MVKLESQQVLIGHPQVVQERPQVQRPLRQVILRQVIRHQVAVLQVIFGMSMAAALFR